jgi:dienelactone hydrolase
MRKNFFLVVILFYVGFITQSSIYSMSFSDNETDDRVRSFLLLTSSVEQDRRFGLSRWDKTGESNYSEIFEGELSTTQNNSLIEQKIPFRFYSSKVTSTEKKPVLVLFPPIDGTFPLENTLGKFLAYMGIHVLVSYPQESLVTPGKNISDINQLVARTAFTPSYLLDWLQTMPQVDRDKIGYLGISMGGIRAMLSMGVDSRPKAGILIVAGGNLPEILTHSDQESVTLFRQQLMEKQNFQTKPELLNYLQQGLLWDPLSFIEDGQQDRFLCIMSDNDKVVPSKNQQELWKALGKPKFYQLSYGHVGSAIVSTFYFKAFYHFLWNRWTMSHTKENSVFYKQQEVKMDRYLKKEFGEVQ